MAYTQKILRRIKGKVAQWFSALAAMAILSARTWVQVPHRPMEFFACNKVSPLNNRTPNP